MRIVCTARRLNMDFSPKKKKNIVRVITAFVMVLMLVIGISSYQHSIAPSYNMPVLADENETVIGDHDTLNKDGQYITSNELKAALQELDHWYFPVILTILGFSSIYIVFLGVMLAKADNADARQQAKKRMMNFLIGIVAVVLLMVLMKLITSNIDLVLDFLGYNDVTVEK